MEPIEPFFETSFPTSKRERRKIAKKGAQRAAFSSTLESIGGGESSAATPDYSSLGSSEQDLEAILDNVQELGEQLKEHVTISTVRSYRQAVRDFLAYVVKNTLAVELHDSSPNVQKRKRFTLIKVIDQKLERFAAEIVQNQRTQLEILRQIDEITGLLIDLLR